MKALDFDELYNVRARLEDIPLFVKKEDEKGNMYIYMYDHASPIKGYVKSKALCEPLPYEGRFGVGFTVKLHNDNSTHYALKAYYLKLLNRTVCSANDACEFCPLYSVDRYCTCDC